MHNTPFKALDAADQDRLLARAADGDLAAERDSAPAPILSLAQMQL